MLEVHEFKDGRFGIADETYMISFRKRGTLSFDRRQDCERAIQRLTESGITTVVQACEIRPQRKLEEILFADLAW